MNWSAVIFLALAIGAHGVPDAELEAEEARQGTTGTPTNTTATTNSTTSTVNSTLTSIPETNTTVSNSTTESSTQTSTVNVSTTVSTASPSTVNSTTIGSNVTSVTSIPNTTLPPGALDAQCRNRFRLFTDFGGNVSFDNINPEYPCHVYCRIRFIIFDFVRYFNLQDMTSCGDNRVCRVGRCVQALSQDEINRCQERYPGLNVTALPGTNQCEITCNPTWSARFFFGRRPVYRTDGVSCQYEGLFGALVGAGQCRNGRCRRVR